MKIGLVYSAGVAVTADEGSKAGASLEPPDPERSNGTDIDHRER